MMMTGRRCASIQIPFSIHTAMNSCNALTRKQGFATTWEAAMKIVNANTHPFKRYASRVPAAQPAIRMGRVVPKAAPAILRNAPASLRNQSVEITIAKKERNSVALRTAFLTIAQPESTFDSISQDILTTTP